MTVSRFDCLTRWAASLLLIGLGLEVLIRESQFDGHLGLFLLLALALVIGAQVAVLANALGVQGPISVGALGGLLSSPLGMIAVLAHAVSIVLLAGVGALRYVMLMDARLFLSFIPRASVV